METEIVFSKFKNATTAVYTMRMKHNRTFYFIGSYDDDDIDID